MRDFFKELLNKLYPLTGIDQVGKLSDQQITELLNELEAESKSKLWMHIKQEIIQRVIMDAVKNDPEFYGLNVKFLRRSLHKFWEQSGQRILEAETKQELKPLVRTPEELQRIDKIATQYLKQLEAIHLPEMPKMSKKEIEEEGQVRPKVNRYKPDPQYVIEHQKQLRKFQEMTVRERHPEFSDDEVEKYLNKL
ncbi:MAG: hypothetical protein WAZ98_03795 [Cyclobacteriaceae bacterium]